MLRLLSSGFLETEKGGITELFNDNYFCVDFDKNGKLVALLGDAISKAALQITYASLQILGVVCLITTGVIYIIVAKLRNYHGKALACHTLHLALAMILNVINSFYNDKISYLSHLANFGHLSSYAWLMVMWSV